MLLDVCNAPTRYLVTGHCGLWKDWQKPGLAQTLIRLILRSYVMPTVHILH
jgi:hypothetical protein